MTAESPRRPRIFTMGHSDRSLEAFLAVLERSSIRLVADIRSNPASARFPQFERFALAAALERRGLVYRWFRELGGRRPPAPGEEEHTAFADVWQRRYAAAMNTRPLAEAAENVVGLAASTVAVLLCAERDFRECHRALLADKLTLLGARVVHILDLENAEDHVLHPDLVVEGDHLAYRKKQLDLLG